MSVYNNWSTGSNYSKTFAPTDLLCYFEYTLEFLIRFYEDLPIRMTFNSIFQFQKFYISKLLNKLTFYYNGNTIANLITDFTIANDVDYLVTLRVFKDISGTGNVVIINVNNQRFSKILTNFACDVTNNIIMKFQKTSTSTITTDITNVYLRYIRVKSYAMSDGELNSRVGIVDFSKEDRLILSYDFQVQFDTTTESSQNLFYSTMSDSTLESVNMLRNYNTGSKLCGKNCYTNFNNINSLDVKKFLKFSGSNVLPLSYTTTTIEYPLSPISEFSLDFWIKFDDSCNNFTTANKIYFIKNLNK